MIVLAPEPDAGPTNPPAMSYVLEHAVPSTIVAAAPPAAVRKRRRLIVSVIAVPPLRS